MITEFDHSKWKERLLKVASEFSTFPGFSAEVTMQANHYCWDSHLGQFAGLALSKQVEEKTFEFMLSLRCPLCNYSLLCLDLQSQNGEFTRFSEHPILPKAERIQLIFHAVSAPAPGLERDGSIAESMLSAENVVNSISRILNQGLGPDFNAR